ncbi:MAG: hypothetical protein ACI9FN_001246 [Saprospiraceae bacterium]|jgi:hypothetical protein
MINDPQPLSMTASGGRNIQTIALRIFMVLAFNSSNGPETKAVRAYRLTKEKVRRKGKYEFSKGYWIYGSKLIDKDK